MRAGHLHPTLRDVLSTFQSPEAGGLPKAIEEKFFTCLRLKNGTAKVTYSQRLDGLIELVGSRLPGIRPLRIMDVGISSGISTLEWMDSLARRNVDYHMFAVDLMTRAVLIRLKEGIDVLTDMTGSPLMIDLHRQWIPYPAGKRNWIRHFLPLAAIRSSLLIVGPRAARSAEQGNGAAQRRLKGEIVPLVYSRLRNHKQVTLLEANIADPHALPRGLHVIRAANILNRGYFNPEQLSAIVRNLRLSLCKGGLLAVVRTDVDERTTGTLFSLNHAGSLVAMERINGGSEIEDLICALPCDNAAHRCPAE